MSITAWDTPKKMPPQRGKLYNGSTARRQITA
jgi:hypothetical protein